MSATRMKRRCTVFATAVGLSVTALQCQVTPSRVGAPDDAQLQLDITPPDTVDVGGSAKVQATLLLVSGETAGKGWEITVRVSRGRIEESTGTVKRLSTNDDGFVLANVVVGDVVGPLIVEARSRDAVTKDTLVVRKKSAM